MSIHNHSLDFAVPIPVVHTHRKNDPKFVVMHYTAGPSVSSAVNAYRSRRVSAHITIDRDGTVYQHVPFNIQAWHAGPSKWMGYSGLNKYSIGIEHVNLGWFRKNATHYYRPGYRIPIGEAPDMVPSPHPRLGSGIFWWEPYTEEQLAASERVVDALVNGYPILDVVTHEEIDTRGWKTDPGPAFPMDRFKRILHEANLHDRRNDYIPYEVTASALNVRTGPGTAFPAFARIHRGDTVDVIDSSGVWKRILVGGNSDGWVHGRYLRAV